MTAVSNSAHEREQFWLTAWYQGRWWLWLLWPLSLLLVGIAALRRLWQQGRATDIPVPVIVVGNITLGGTGKTPVIIALVNYLRERGYKPGVVSRGYGSAAPNYPYLVTPSSSVAYSGDEPLLIALETGGPVMIGADRVVAAQALIAEHGCDVLLSDDGMQHYRLQRHWEVCLIDGQRGLGNGLCLPAGPLREPGRRLRSVNAVITNGGQVPEISNDHCWTMELQANAWVNLHDGRSVPTKPLPWGKAGGELAMTGIGNPQRFASSLSELGLEPELTAFPDHYQFSEQDLSFAANRVLLMTAKDAVKCQSFAAPDWWYLSVQAVIDQRFYAQLDNFLSGWQKTN